MAPNLKPGTYRITVAKQGFKSAAIDDVKVDVQQSRSVDVTLEVGQATEVVTVSGRAATVETTSSTVSQTIENKRLVDLPLNGRNPFSLATLAPGVAPAPGSSPFISGGRNATSEVTIDGMSNVNAENNVSILDLNYTPSVDAVQEFSVQTNSVSAEFGRLGGGVINLVTKSGSNTFHATAFGFGRNSKLDATNFFTNRAGQKPGSFKRNQFGGNVGGPVVHEQDVLLRRTTKACARSLAPCRRSPCRSRSGATATSRICATPNGQPIIIYDPATTRPDPNNPGSFIRDPFPGNIIPPSRISAVGRAPDAVLAAAQHGADERVHPGEQLRRRRARNPATATASTRASITSSTTSGARSSATRSRTKTARSFNSFQNAASSSGGDGPTFTTDAEPLDRQQLRGLADASWSTCATA